MRKGQTKRVWTPEQKPEIVHKHLDEHISVRTLEKEYNADRGMICRWVKEYISEGESAFIPKGHPGNPFAALHILHTDQGAVYSSRAFCHAHEHYNILRSMSRGGTPTDNPIMEALNGWIKEELYLDFGLAEAENLPDLLNRYVYFFNNHRPAAALGYKSPVQYKTELSFV